MVSALGLIYKGRKTKELLYGFDDERPCALQLFGARAGEIAEGAEIALTIRGFDALEVNMACPMPKVTKKGAGSKLMEFPDEAAAMMRELKKFGLPVWAEGAPYAARLGAHDRGFLREAFRCGRGFRIRPRPHAGAEI